MNNHHFGQTSTTPMYFLGDAVNIVLKGEAHTLVSQDNKYTTLRNSDGVAQKFPHAQLYALSLEGKLTVEREQKTPAGLNSHRDFVDVAEDKAFKALAYELAIKLFMEMEAAGRKHPILADFGWKRRVTLGNACLKVLLPIIQTSIIEQMSAKRGGTKLNSVTLPQPPQFRRLHARYVENGCEPASLVDGRAGSKTRASRFNPQDYKVWVEHAKLYADPRRPTMAACFQKLEATVHKLNHELTSTAQRKYTLPSRKTFEKLVKSPGEYYLTKMRYSEGYARKKFLATRNGLEILAPGQRVEIDEWRIDLQSHLALSGVWAEMSEEQRKAIKKTRVWLTVAIDVATKCILALRFSTRAPSAHSSLAALEMIVSHKEHISAVIGCADEWIYSLVPQAIYSDAGAAFRDMQFRMAVAALGCAHVIPPSGSPSARGNIESVIRTFGVKFLHYFTGRTFSNIYERKKSKGTEEVGLRVDEVNILLPRPIIDIYHNTPHSGLAGETPAQAWNRLSAEYGMLPPLTSQQRRRIFGTRVTRKVTERGVRFLGIHYQSSQLQRLWAQRAMLPNSPTPKVDIKVDRFNLQTISYHDGERWHDIEAGLGLPEGVSVWEWVYAANHLRTINAASAEVKLSVVYDTINEMRNSGAAATARAEFGTDIPTAAAYDKLERESFAREITNDLLDRTVNLSDLKMGHNPMVTGIEAFQHLALNKTEAEAALQEEQDWIEDYVDVSASAFGDFDTTEDIPVGFEE